MQAILKSLRKVHIAILIVIAVLILARLFLPFGAKYGINWYLDKKLTNYQGHIEDIDLTLYRGAYQIQDLKIWKRTKSDKEPLIKIDEIDLSLAWRALFKGKLLGDLKVDGVSLVLIDSDNKKKKQLGAGEEDWKTIVGKLVPIELESFEMTNSEAHLVNRDLKVPVDVVLDKIFIKATNIKNTEDRKELLPTTMTAKARFQKSANLHADANINLLSKIPAFEAKFKLEKLDITKLNEFFLVYGPFTFTKGTFSLYAEVSTKQNRVVGYVKPFFENLDVISDEEHFDSPKRFFNEIGLAMGNFILRNRKEKAVAAKIAFEGASKAPDIDTWASLLSSVRNAFIEALKRNIENTISIEDVPEKKK